MKYESGIILNFSFGNFEIKDIWFEENDLLKSYMILKLKWYQNLIAFETFDSINTWFGSLGFI